MEVLAPHIVMGKYSASDLQNGQELFTLAKSQLVVDRNSTTGKLQVMVLDNDLGEVIHPDFNDSEMVTIHGIDKVLVIPKIKSHMDEIEGDLPPSREAPPYDMDLPKPQSGLSTENSAASLSQSWFLGVAGLLVLCSMMM